MGTEVVLALLEGGQQVPKQGPDPWCLDWVGGSHHTEFGDPRSQLLQSSKAVLEQFQGDEGRESGGIG